MEQNTPNISAKKKKSQLSLSDVAIFPSQQIRAQLGINPIRE
jgi:hypothetical protein